MIKLSILFFALSQSVALAAPDATDTKAEKVKVADCVDGKSYYSTSNTHQGACARHGGVASWADGSPVKVRATKKGEYR